MAEFLEQVTIVCGHNRFLVEVCGTQSAWNLLSEASENDRQAFFKSLRRSENTEDVVYLEQDKPEESYRLLFMQLKKQIGQSSGDFDKGRAAVLESLPSVFKKNELFKDVMLGLADLCFAHSCVMHATGILFRKEEAIEPLTEQEKRSSGLAGIPLEHIDEAERSHELLARVYSAGLPPLVLFRNQEIRFPTRSWFPAGLLQEWQPWKQNVELRPGDLLALHGELKSGGKETLKDFHAQLWGELDKLQSPVSIIRIKIL